MRRVAMGIAFGAALMLCGGSAMAADNLIPGKITIIKTGKLAKIVAKPTTSFPLPGVAPSGGSVRIRDTGGASPTNTYTLSGAGWNGLGNPPGAKGYKYKGAGAPGDPCKVIIVKTAVIKAICKGTDVTAATPPYSGNAAWRLDTGAGDRYCAEFGGTPVKNDPGNFKRKDAPPPASCGSPSGAFLE